MTMVTNVKTFDRHYRAVPAAQRQMLESFRAAHPPREFRVADKIWPYLDSGKGEKCLLFLSGAFLQADMWFYAITKFERDFRILAPDTPTLTQLSIHQALAALPRLMDEHGIQRASVIGLSAGGGIAQLLLHRYPERIENVVLSHTGVIEFHPELQDDIRRLMGLVKILPLFLIRWVLIRRTGGKLPESSQWRAFHNAFYREASGRFTRQAMLNFLQDGIDIRNQFIFDPEDLNDWNGRMLILSSRDDKVTLPSLEKLTARYPWAQLHLFEEGGHHTFMLYPETYGETLRKFLHPT